MLPIPTHTHTLNSCKKKKKKSMRSAHYVFNLFSFSKSSDIFCMEKMTQALNFFKAVNSCTIRNFHFCTYAYIKILCICKVLYLTSQGHPIDQEAIFIISMIYRSWVSLPFKHCIWLKIWQQKKNGLLASALWT